MAGTLSKLSMRECFISDFCVLLVFGQRPFQCLTVWGMCPLNSLYVWLSVVDKHGIWWLRGSLPIQSVRRRSSDRERPIIVTLALFEQVFAFQDPWVNNELSLTPLLHYLGIVSIPFNTLIPRKIFVTPHFFNWYSTVTAWFRRRSRLRFQRWSQSIRWLVPLRIATFKMWTTDRHRVTLLPQLRVWTSSSTNIEVCLLAAQAISIHCWHFEPKVPTMNTIKSRLKDRCDTCRI